MKSDKVESWVLPYAHNVDIPITVNPQSVEQHLQTLKDLEEQHSIRMKNLYPNIQFSTPKKGL